MWVLGLLLFAYAAGGYYCLWIVLSLMDQQNGAVGDAFSPKIWIAVIIVALLFGPLIYYGLMIRCVLIPRWRPRHVVILPIDDAEFNVMWKSNAERR